MKKLVKNRIARREYSIEDTYQAGIKLIGPEVKSLRNKAASLKGSFIKIVDEEAFLVNAQINHYKFANNEDYDPKRTRKLLLKKKEILEIMGKIQRKGWAAIPLSFDLTHNKIKLHFGVGRGKKEYEKREKIKKRQLKRELNRKMKKAHLKI